MKIETLIAVLVGWAVVQPLAFAGEPTMVKNRESAEEKLHSLAVSKSHDLASLKRALHGATQAQLDEKYETYAGEMTSYAGDITSCFNVWLNANEMKMGKEKASKQISPDTMIERADTVMKEHLTKGNAAKRELVKITSAAAVKQVDASHSWDMPVSLSQIKPGPKVTEVNQISPWILRQIPKSMR